MKRRQAASRAGGRAPLDVGDVLQPAGERVVRAHAQHLPVCAGPKQGRGVRPDTMMSVALQPCESLGRESEEAGDASDSARRAPSSPSSIIAYAPSARTLCTLPAARGCPPSSTTSTGSLSPCTGRTLGIGYGCVPVCLVYRNNKELASGRACQQHGWLVMEGSGWVRSTACTARSAACGV